MLVTLELENLGECVIASLGIRHHDNEFEFITGYLNINEVIISPDVTNHRPSRPNAKWVTLNYNKNGNQIECLLVDEIHNNSDLIIKEYKKNI